MGNTTGEDAAEVEQRKRRKSTKQLTILKKDERRYKGLTATRLMVLRYRGKEAGR